MAQTSGRRRGRTALFAVAAACFLLTLPCAGLGVLGLLGVVADVGTDENHQIGLGFLKLALIPLSLAIITLLAALWLGRSKKTG
ncbi:MAG: hypothetical protein KDA21_15500 [Phycisphaerales bacterium]|nr:hypothetical protein [Phycisphaerales bacterium]